MVGLSRKLHLLFQSGALVILCSRKSSGFNLESSHCIRYRASARGNIKSTLFSPANTFPKPGLFSTTLDSASNSEGKNWQSSESGTSATSNLTTNAATDAGSWDHIIAPSSVEKPTDHTEITTLDRVGIVVFTLSAISSFLALVWNSPGAWRYFMAGGLCAAISHTIPTPIDVIKTRKQVDSGLVDKSFMEAGRVIMKEDGFKALWAGLGPTTFGYLLEGAIKFGVYEVMKPALKTWLSGIASFSSSLSFLNSQFYSFFLSGIASGLAASFILCPMEVIRIRLVAEPNYTSGGWLRGGYKIMRKEGVNGFSKGLNPMILKQVPYTVTKNVSFDLITKFFYSSLLQNGVAAISSTMKFAIPLISAAIASVLSSLTSQPGDTILSLSCAHGGDYRTRDISRNILNSDRGIAGFFVGTKTRLLHVGMIVTIQLLIYDFVKRLCGIGATGLH